MKTIFKIQGSSLVLKSYDHNVPVYPGMQVVLKEKIYIVEQATLFLDEDEVTVVVKRDNSHK